MPRSVITPEIGEAIKIAVAGGTSGLREFARSAGIPEGTVLSWAHRKGLMVQIATAKMAANSKLAREIAQPDASNAINPLQSVANALAQRGQQHVERMADFSENVGQHVRTMKPAMGLKRIHEVEKFDRVARRTLGLGEGTGNGTLNLHILAGSAAIQVSQS